jgi:hypothetical protein
MIATYPPFGCPICEVLARVVGLELGKATRLLRRVLEQACHRCGFSLNIHSILHPHVSWHCGGVVGDAPAEKWRAIGMAPGRDSL